MAVNITSSVSSADVQLPYNGCRMSSGTITSCTSQGSTISAQMVYDQNSTISSSSTYMSAQHPHDWDNDSTASVGSRNRPIEELYEADGNIPVETVERDCLQNGQQPPKGNHIVCFFLCCTCKSFKVQASLANQSELKELNF